MTKTTTKPIKEPAPLIVLGYHENYKPRAARFPAKDADLVTKAAQLMDLMVYEAASEDLAALAKKLPDGRLYGNGRGFVPNVRQSLYSEIIATLAVEPQAALGKDQDELPVATGLPPDLGRHRAWASRPRSGKPRLRVVGSHRPRSHRRYVHVAVSRLPEAAKVCAPSCGSRVDEPSDRITRVGGPGGHRAIGAIVFFAPIKIPYPLAHPPWCCRGGWIRFGITKKRSAKDMNVARCIRTQGKES
jgi:hypothetical protein